MKLSRRITFHFLFQFILVFIAIFLIASLIMIGVVYLFSNDELKTHPRKAIVENLPISTVINNEDDIQIGETWEDSLKENHMWMQLVNKNGEVIYDLNIPEKELPTSYSINELLELEETKNLGPYQIDTYFDSWEKDPYYYIFGYIDENTEKLKKLYQDYSNNQGFVDEQQLKPLQTRLQKEDAVIEIFKNGEQKQLIGAKSRVSSDKLDVLGRMHAPGKYQTKAFSYNDPENKVSWTLHIQNEDYQGTKLHILPNSDLQILLIACLISLLIAILLSIWYGYRYGKPLMLLIRWLDYMEARQYQVVLEGKERQRIYKKNGKVKLRYRLYKEVFQSLTNLTNKLSIAEKEQLKLDQTREEWMSGISHDLRTPLSSIQGYGHMLESNQYDFSKDELQQIGQVIRNQSDYMVNLVNDFSLVFQLKNSVISIDKKPVDMNAFIEKVVRTFQQNIKWQEYTLVFHPSNESNKIMIDPTWFNRVLDNLIANALKHNPVGTEIHITLEREAAKTIIQIIDNGVGMEPEVIENLFNRYYRGTATHEQSEGEGLGMSIAKAIIDLHQGALEIESKPGNGTTLSIILYNLKE